MPHYGRKCIVPFLLAGVFALAAGAFTSEYAGAGRIPTGFNTSAGIAVDGAGHLFVAGDTAVRIFTPAGKQVSSFPLRGEPTCLAVDDTAVFIGFIDHVEVYSRKGVRLARWATPGKNAYITSIAVSARDVWVADAGARVLLRYTRDGKVGARLGKKDAARGIPGLVAPSPHLDVAVGPDGLVWVANPGRHQLEGYARDGALKKRWGAAASGAKGFMGCCNPSDFAILPGGGFVTSEKGVQRVKTYRADGTYAGLVADAASFPTRVFALDVAADRQGRILVLDPGANTVCVFARTAERRDGKR